MKYYFPKQYIILFTTLCIFTSCNLTGNFAIVKRQHTKGYYIQTPSFLQNSNSKTVQLKKKIGTAVETASVKEDTENLIASTNSIPLAEVVKPGKIIPQVNFNAKQQYNNKIKPIGKDTIKKNNSSSETSKKTVDKTSDNDKKMDWVSLTAFILCCVGCLLAPFMFFSSIFDYTVLLDYSICYPLVGIILGFIGKHRTKKNYERLKGKDFAIAAILMGFLYYIVLIAIVIIGMYLSSNSR
jgi:hypothetical protein